MRDEATFLIPCKEYPHTDFQERAEELYELCAQTRTGKLKPSHAYVQIPRLGLYQTAKEPMRSFVDSIIADEKKEGMLAICLAHGFPWADFQDAGASIIVYTDGKPELAQAEAQRLANRFFDLRETGQARLASVETAVEEAMSVDSGTAIIADMSDNPGGGAASDSTFILQELLRQGAKDVLLAYFWDPTALDLAFAAGVGAGADQVTVSTTIPTAVTICAGCSSSKSIASTEPTSRRRSKSGRRSKKRSSASPIAPSRC